MNPGTSLKEMFSHLSPILNKFCPSFCTFSTKKQSQKQKERTKEIVIAIIKDNWPGRNNSNSCLSEKLYPAISSAVASKN